MAFSQAKTMMGSALEKRKKDTDRVDEQPESESKKRKPESERPRDTDVPKSDRTGPYDDPHRRPA